MTNLHETAAQVAAVEAEIDRLRTTIDAQLAERDTILAAIAAADGALAEAQARHGEALAARALGEVDDGVVAAVKGALKDASAAAEKARKRASVAQDYADAAACLQSRHVAAHDALSRALAERDRARADAAEQALRDAASEYEQHARAAVAALARVAGLELHLNFDHARNVRVLPADWSRVHIPNTGAGAPPDFAAMQRDARADAAQKFGVTATGAGSFVPPQRVDRFVAPPARFA